MNESRSNRWPKVADSLTAPEGAIAADWMIPDVLLRHPEVRPVFDRYGLRGCGGALGPAESVGYFARAHGVGLAPLLDELNRARGKRPPAAATPPAAQAADAIYRRFFLAGIIATLTAGATWGAVLLWRLAAAGSFGALSVAEVNAHGHAQIFGWVGLFVMGFAYQAFPRFKHGSLARPRLALATFPIYLAGLVLRTVFEPLAASPGFLATALAGSVLEIAAIAAFAGIVGRTILLSRAPRAPSDAFLLAATFWFVVQATYDAGLLFLTATAPSAEVLVARVATFQAPLRDIQLHGFALLMILGVSQRFLPGMLGLGRTPSARLSFSALLALNLGLAGEVAGYFGFRLTRSPAWAILLWGSAALITAAAASLANRLGVFSPAEERNRSLKFIRAAYAWLFVSLGMLLFFPVYLRLTGQPFSHAYFGATRHAITVGFISLMILGVASKVVPNLNGVPASALPPLWVPFALLNIGCTLRVAGQTLTDFTPLAFPFAGVSGILEVAGLAVWGAHIARVMFGAYHRATFPDARPRAASPDHVVGWLVRVAPETIEVLAAHGFKEITNPLLRATVANTVTIHRACRMHGVDEAALIEGLDEALAAAPPPAGPSPGIKIELPVLSPRAPSPGPPHRG